MVKRIVAKLLLFVIIGGVFVSPVYATAEDKWINFYYGVGCPHCAKEKEFLGEIKEYYDGKLKINEYEIYENQVNAEKFNEDIDRFGIELAGVPLLVMGDSYVIGFGDKATTGRQIVQELDEYYEIKTNIPEVIFNGEIESDGVEANKKGLFLKVFGINIDLKTVSLPAATILIAFVDGFNPCAMWILIFLITMLINMRDKKRLYILGSTFILVSGIMYFLFLAAWFNLFKLVGYIYWIKAAVGIVAIICGLIHLKNGLLSGGGCKVTNQEQRVGIMNRIKKILGEKSFVLAMTGIVTLAISVNLIELVCSAGLPAIYTNLISSINLATGKYYFYLILYTLIFMLDDLLIFFIAVKTFEVSGISSKYSRISGIVGGFLIFIIGIILITKPELLMFNY